VLVGFRTYRMLDHGAKTGPAHGRCNCDALMARGARLSHRLSADGISFDPIGMAKHSNGTAAGTRVTRWLTGWEGGAMWRTVSFFPGFPAADFSR